MVIGLLALISAVLLSIVSAFFSISGIVTIFSGAVLGTAIMGIVLEFSKISATIWLYYFWKKANRLIKTYFVTAIVILILISTIGIFGFLSKAYVGQGEVTESIETEIEQVQRYIDRENDKIERANKQLKQLNKAIDKYIDLNVVTKGLEKREEQEEERGRLNSRINEARENIAGYEDKLFKLKQRLNEHKVNVGPVKYIAILLYGEKNAEDFYDNAARILIILIVIVFDPFAVLLMVAGNVALDKRPKKKKGRPKGSTNKKKTTAKQPPKTEGEKPPKFENKEKKEPHPPSNSTKKEEEEEKETPPKLHKKRKPITKR